MAPMRTTDESPQGPADPAPAGGRPCAAGLRPGSAATERAFVVQVGAADREQGEVFAGRVQHLATSDGGNFASAEGLIAIMRRVLERLRREEDSGDDDPE